MTTKIDLMLSDEEISSNISQAVIESNFNNASAIVNLLCKNAKFHSSLSILSTCFEKKLSFIMNHIFAICANDDYKSLEFFIQNSPFRDQYEYDVAFLWACDSNSIGCCKILMKIIDHESIAIKNGFVSAVEKRHEDVISLFLNEVGFDASYNFNFAIKYAIENDFPSLYKTLIEHPCVLVCSFKNNQGIHSSSQLKDVLKKFPELFS